MDSKYIVAIEISGTQVKGAVATVPVHASQRAYPTIDAIVSEDNNDSVQYGRVQNLVSTTNYINLVMHRLQTEPAIAAGTITGCYVGLAGRSVGSEKATVNLELPDETEITKDIVLQLMREATQTSATNKKVIKVLPRRFYVDGQPSNNPVGTMGRRLKGDFTLVVANPINQRNLELVLREKAGIRVIDYVVTPLAVADVVLAEEDKQLGCMMVDLGAQTTTVAIYKDRSLQWLATLPMGSDNITKDIAKGLNVTIEKAEVMKCTQGDAMPDPDRQGDEYAQMNSYVRARALEIVLNITENIKYAGYRPQDLAGGIVLCGRGSRLKHLDKLLADNSKLKVRHAAIPGNITFNLSTNNVRPADYLSLVSIVANVAHRRNYESCVKMAPTPVETLPDDIDIKDNVAAQTAPKPAVEQPADDRSTRVNANPVTSNFRPIPVGEDDNDNSWAQDDPIAIDTADDKGADKAAPAEQTPPTKPTRGGFMSKLRAKVTGLITIDDDTPLDDE